jgi:hypothetical protein
MAIGHCQSLHCSFMGNLLSSLGEALKTMHSIKFGLSHHAQMMLLSNKGVHRYDSKDIN